MLLEFLSSLGLGEQLMTAAVLAMAVWYLFRGKSVIGTVIAAVGTATTIMMGTLAVIAISIGLGWFDPQPGVVFDHVATAIAAVKDIAMDVVADWLSEVLP